MVASMDIRIKEILQTIEQARERCGRGDDPVEIIAITKNRSLPLIKELMAKGFSTLGENRVQELLEKDSLLEEADLQWHMVGHLQRNKVKYLVRMERCVMIQSLDSSRLAEKLEEELEKENRSMEVLIQVNIAADPKKYGFLEDQLYPFLDNLDKYRYIKIKGLMTILPYVSDPQEVRPFFRQLFQIYQKLQEEGIPNGEMKYLSMGMTNDYAIAVEEGANMIRIGSALFEPLPDDWGKRG